MYIYIYVVCINIYIYHYCTYPLLNKGVPTADSAHRSPSQRWQLRTPGGVLSQVRHGTGWHLCWHLRNGWDFHLIAL